MLYRQTMFLRCFCCLLKTVISKKFSIFYYSIRFPFAVDQGGRISTNAGAALAHQHYHAVGGPRGEFLKILRPPGAIFSRFWAPGGDFSRFWSPRGDFSRFWLALAHQHYNAGEGRRPRFFGRRRPTVDIVSAVGHWRCGHCRIQAASGRKMTRTRLWLGKLQ